MARIRASPAAVSRETGSRLTGEWGVEDTDGRTVFLDRSAPPADRPAAPAPSQDALARIRPARARRRPVAAAREPVPRRRALWILALGATGAWAAVATGIALSGRATIERMADQEAESRRLQTEKVRALTRQLVGAASHGLLEQDGLSDRLADIIARQVQLETRQATLNNLGERLAEGRGGPSPSPASGAPPAPATHPAPAPAPEPARALGRRSALDPEEPGSAGQASLSGQASLPGQAPARVNATSRIARDLAGRPLADQFGRIESALDRLGGDEARTLDLFARMARTDQEGVRSAITLVGLKVDAAEIGPAARPALRRRGGDPFEEDAEALSGLIAERNRWLAVADTIPFAPPLEGAGLTSNFGTRKDPFTGVATMHAGMDFRSPIGTPVHVSARGRVITAGVTGGYGNLVEIEHGHDLVTRYGHLSAMNVTVGQAVTPGTVVGLIGSTGRSTGPHLHYETRIAGTAVDPARFLRAGQEALGHPALGPAVPSAAAPPADASGEEPADD